MRDSLISAVSFLVSIPRAPRFYEFNWSFSRDVADVESIQPRLLMGSNMVVVIEWLQFAHCTACTAS